MFAISLAFFYTYSCLSKEVYGKPVGTSHQRSKCNLPFKVILKFSTRMAQKSWCTSKKFSLKEYKCKQIQM